MDHVTATILFIIFIALLVFLALRELFCWYWKLNAISGLLRQIEENTRPAEKTFGTDL